jgi:hypothetical protein
VTYAWSITKTHLKIIKDEKTWLKNPKEKCQQGMMKLHQVTTWAIKKNTLEISQGTTFG